MVLVIVTIMREVKTPRADFASRETQRWSKEIVFSDMKWESIAYIYVAEETVRLGRITMARLTGHGLAVQFAVCGCNGMVLCLKWALVLLSHAPQRHERHRMMPKVPASTRRFMRLRDKRRSISKHHEPPPRFQQHLLSYRIAISHPLSPDAAASTMAIKTGLAALPRVIIRFRDSHYNNRASIHDSNT
jgi:hypothetical protein